MKIKYLAHSAFLITSEKGTKIVTDPYEPEEELRYGEITETADIVTASHQHTDHNYVSVVRGNPKVVKTSEEVKGIKVKAVPAYHDTIGGSRRGPNTIFCFDVDGVNVCHCGDLGHELTAEQVKAIGKVDVLLIPVGGTFTVDAKGAARVAEQLKAKVTIPMHYKTDKTSLPIAGVDEFLKGKNNVVRSGDSEIELTVEKLPGVSQIIVLKPSL
jgi:L-ascorbate metabolism protein UlaG (beta-lactamase superfamily)